MYKPFCIIDVCIIDFCDFVSGQPNAEMYTLQKSSTRPLKDGPLRDII